MLGTGISQILPVLTLCLTARRGDLVLLEQPELHLNPSIQQKLAEFLLAMSRVDRQIIVETHSEYFVTRLRLLQARDEKMAKFIKLLFVEKTKENGTTYREVQTNSFGEIQEWPRGFFDQASNDLRELMKAITEKKIKAQEKGFNTSDT
jgi:predicted ATPase